MGKPVGKAWGKRAKSIKTLDFMQAMISHNPKNPHSKTLEPDCLSSLACDCDTVS
jgi:hypothetical protein